MRRLIRDESGVAMVLVAVSMLTLLGMAALVIDVGELYEERRQLQNGADAAALAIANECADNSGTWPADAEGIAATYTDLNSRDGAGDVISVAFSSDGDFVQVRVRTERSDGVNAVAPLFSAVFGDTGTTVSAVATALCGESGFHPLVLSTCEVGAVAGNPVSVPTGQVTLEWQSGNPKDCEGPSGQLFPGGFGWLEASDCRIEVPKALGADGWWVLSDSGAPPSKAGCEPDDFRGVVYLLEFDDAKGKSDNPFPSGCTPKGSLNCVHVPRIIKIDVQKVRFPPSGQSDRSCDPPAGSRSSNCLSGIIEAVMSIPDAIIDSTKPSRLVPESAFTG